MTKTLGYDPSNRLLSITNDTTTTKFLYDGSDLIAEYDGSGTLLKRYVHGPGDDVSGRCSGVAGDGSHRPLFVQYRDQHGRNAVRRRMGV